MTLYFLADQAPIAFLRRQHYRVAVIGSDFCCLRPCMCVKMVLIVYSCFRVKLLIIVVKKPIKAAYLHRQIDTK